MKIAFVIQRYGPHVAGGAEQLCRQVARRLAGTFNTTILTTTARNFETWAGPDSFAPGVEIVEGLTVHRFAVERPRRPRLFVWQTRVLRRLPHPLAYERKWIEWQGPYAPQLIEHLRRRPAEYDAVLFVSFRYYPSYFGLPVVPSRAALIPTAERDPTLRLKAFRERFQRTPAFIFLTEEERDLVCSVADISKARSLIAGHGVDAPAPIQPGAFVRKYGPRLGLAEADGSRSRAVTSDPAPLVLYVGRVVENKGCGRLFRAFLRYLSERPDSQARLVLAGEIAMPIPAHERIAALGRLEEADKAAALRDCAVFVMPSPYESLSIATLEAMAAGMPVLANGECDVLRGHCRRSGAGIAYAGDREFIRGLEQLLSHPRQREDMGAAGQDYIARNFAWPVVTAKYVEFLRELISGARGTTGTPGT